MLIAIKDNGTVYLAQSISDGMDDTDKFDLILDDNIPFWKVFGNKHCYAACRSALFGANVLRYEPGLFKGVNNAMDILTKTIPNMRSLLEGCKLIDKDKCWNNALIIVKEDKIYHIDPFFILTEIDDLIVSGRGRDFISGGLEWEKDVPIEERIRKVIHSYDELRSEFYFPIVLHNCSTGRKKILWDF